MGALQFVKDLFAGDIRKVKDYIYHDVLIPTAKKMLWDMGSGAWHTIIYENPSTNAPGSSGNGFGMKYWQGSQPPKSERGSQPYTITAMSREYSPQAQKQVVGMVGSSGANTRFDNLVYDTKSKAERLIDILKEKLINKQARGENGVYVTVADMLNEYQRMYEGEIRITSVFTCQDYGWGDLYEARVVPNEAGWYIAWPEPIPVSQLIKKG